MLLKILSFDAEMFVNMQTKRDEREPEVSRDFIYEAVDKYLLLCLLTSSLKEKVDNAKDFYETSWNSIIAPKPRISFFKFR